MPFWGIFWVKGRVKELKFWAPQSRPSEIRDWLSENCNCLPRLLFFNLRRRCLVAMWPGAVVDDEEAALFTAASTRRQFRAVFRSTSSRLLRYRAPVSCNLLPAGEPCPVTGSSASHCRGCADTARRCTMDSSWVQPRSGGKQVMMMMMWKEEQRSTLWLLYQLCSPIRLQTIGISSHNDDNDVDTRPLVVEAWHTKRHRHNQNEDKLWE